MGSTSDGTGSIDRRTAMKLVAGAAVAMATLPGRRLWAAEGGDGFIDVGRVPDAVTVITEADTTDATRRGGTGWEAGGVRIETRPENGALRVTLAAPSAAVKQIRLRWNGSTAGWTRVLGDHWERAYGDLAWREPNAERVHPWYLLARTENATHAVGVRTQPAAFCGWTAASDGVSLTCDVRSGGVGVTLGDRQLHLCDVVARRGSADESPFAATVAFCKSLCPKPRLADHVIYGANDWYYAYGRNTPAGLLADAKLLSELSGDTANRPYSVIDDGWQTKTHAPEGQWSTSRPTFGSMAELAASMREAGVRPGIWMRPLIDEIKAWPAEWHLSRDTNYLDPTRPEVKAIVAADIRRLRGWGYELIKHDFSTFDLMGRWGKDMRAGQVTGDGWSFASRGQTTAEVINDLYKTIADAAGDGVIIGCNTVSHLSAGAFAVNRIGDDTSGNEWARNPQMGVNALAFRAAHQGSFYGADADCCPITTRLEWPKARQWLDLVARSGTPLFVSIDRKAVTPEIRQALAAAIAAASKPAPLAEPLDWMTSKTPSKWKIGGETVTYDWS